jgi:hypothetical protein
MNLALARDAGEASDTSGSSAVWPELPQGKKTATQRQEEFGAHRSPLRRSKTYSTCKQSESNDRKYSHYILPLIPGYKFYDGFEIWTMMIRYFGDGCGTRPEGELLNNICTQLS